MSKSAVIGLLIIVTLSLAALASQVPESTGYAGEA